MPWLGTCISDPCVFFHLSMAIPHNIIPSYLFFATFDPEKVWEPLKWFYVALIDVLLC